jgi:hypothetical protein
VRIQLIKANWDGTTADVYGASTLKNGNLIFYSIIEGAVHVHHTWRADVTHGEDAEFLLRLDNTPVSLACQI